MQKSGHNPVNKEEATMSKIILFAFFDIKAWRKEQWLKEKFSGYAAYQARVRKLIPFIY
jgi:protein-S-isoprenylcysteine O-methyltransferase Ste14